MLFLSQMLKIFIPFRREQIFFFVITVFTCSNKVSSCGFTASYDWDNVIHSQLSGLELPATVVANS